VSATEFHVEVSQDSVTGYVGEPGSRLEFIAECPLELDQLAVATVALMDRWLNFWQRINESKIKHKESLLQPETFEVLGRQLWGLLLANPVGQRLVQCLGDPRFQPLQLMLSFEDSANTTLRGLPWEFLYEPSGNSFLAARTGLLLTRYVPREDERAKVVSVDDNDQLRVLLVAALPSGEERFEELFDRYRWKMQALFEALRNVSGLDVLDPIASWDQDLIAAKLSVPDKPCHIVHVVGVCRGAPGDPKLYLGGGDDGFEDPQPLVDALTIRAAERPRLVILQLCDYKDGDASENFERLAPALIKGEIPAVLALQYAATADEASVGASFYQKLLDGERVGSAVQASRIDLIRHRDRRFGTPVLYLGEDGYLRRGPGLAGGAGTATAVLATPSGASEGAREVLLRLGGVVYRSTDLDDDKRQSLLTWLGGLTFEGDAAESARQSVRLALRGPNDAATINVLKLMMDALPREKEASHGSQ
jgi:hypothetical protein